MFCLDYHRNSTKLPTSSSASSTLSIPAYHRTPTALPAHLCRCVKHHLFALRPFKTYPHYDCYSETALRSNGSVYLSIHYGTSLRSPAHLNRKDRCHYYLQRVKHAVSASVRPNRKRDHYPCFDDGEEGWELPHHLRPISVFSGLLEVDLPAVEILVEAPETEGEGRLEMRLDETVARSVDEMSMNERVVSSLAETSAADTNNIATPKPEDGDLKFWYAYDRIRKLGPICLDLGMWCTAVNAFVGVPFLFIVRLPNRGRRARRRRARLTRRLNMVVIPSTPVKGRMVVLRGRGSLGLCRPRRFLVGHCR